MFSNSATDTRPPSSSTCASSADITSSPGRRHTDEELVRLGAATVTLPGLGHNAHAESPELAVALLDAYR